MRLLTYDMPLIPNEWLVPRQYFGRHGTRCPVIDRVFGGIDRDNDSAGRYVMVEGVWFPPQPGHAALGENCCNAKKDCSQGATLEYEYGNWGAGHGRLTTNCGYVGPQEVGTESSEYST